MAKQLYNLEAEKDVIASLLDEHITSSEILGILKQEHFYDKRNGLIFKSIQNLVDLGEPIDIASIFEENHIEITLEYSYELQREVKRPLHKAMIVHDKWTVRELIKTAKQIIQNATESETDTKEQTDFAIESIKKINDVSYMETDITLYALLDDVFADVKKRMTENITTLKSSYFPSMNRFTGGFRDGDYLSLSGKDKAGKTSLAYSMALDFAINQKIPVGIFSLEMTKETLAWKAISYECEIEYWKLRNPQGDTRLSEKELDEVALRAQRRFANTKIYTCDSIFNERQIRNKIKQWKKDFGVRFIVIDYIGLVPSSGRFDNREREIAYLSRFFKLVSHELKITILVLSQQNRQGEIAESKGLDRDSDFAFSIKKPLEEGIESIRDNKGQNIPMQDNYFLVTLERSRHSQQGKQFIAQYSNTKFIELDYEHF